MSTYGNCESKHLFGESSSSPDSDSDRYTSDTRGTDMTVRSVISLTFVPCLLSSFVLSLERRRDVRHGAIFVSGACVRTCVQGPGALAVCASLAALFSQKHKTLGQRRPWRRRCCRPRLASVCFVYPLSRTDYYRHMQIHRVMSMA